MQQHLICGESLTLEPRKCEKNDCRLFSKVPVTNLDVSTVEAEEPSECNQVTNSGCHVCHAEDELRTHAVQCDALDRPCSSIKHDGSWIIDSLSNSLSELSSSQHDSVVTAINMYAAVVHEEDSDELKRLVDGPRLNEISCLVPAVNDKWCSDDTRDGINCIEFLDESAQPGQSNGAHKNALMFMPSSVPGTLYCPPGFEALLDAGQLVIHMGNLRHDYIFNVRCEKRMEVVNELRRVLFYAEEEPPQSERGSFLFKLYDKNKQEIAHIFCPASDTCLLCGLSWLWLKSCRFQAIVYCPPGVISGFVRQERTCLVQEFQILNAREEVILRLRGAPTDLEIYSVDLQHGIGRLSVHGWVGVMHEIRRTANDYGLTFPVDLDVRVKGLLLASVFAIDWLYRTGGGRS